MVYADMCIRGSADACMPSVHADCTVCSAALGRQSRHSWLAACIPNGLLQKGVDSAVAKVCVASIGMG